MRMILATIQPTKLATVRTALRQIGVTALTVCDAHGYARQRGQTAMFRGSEYRVDLLRKLALEIAVQEDQLEAVIETLQAASRTGHQGQIGDGKIFVLPLVRMVDIGEGRSPAGDAGAVFEVPAVDPPSESLP